MLKRRSIFCLGFTVVQGLALSVTYASGTRSVAPEPGLQKEVARYQRKIEKYKNEYKNARAEVGEFYFRGQVDHASGRGEAMLGVASRLSEASQVPLQKVIKYTRKLRELTGEGSSSESQAGTPKSDLTR